jgi:multidrug efflux pump subunit AcrB
MQLRSLLYRHATDEVDRSQYWFARLSSPIIFLTLTLAAAGAYLAFNIPISVFPSTDFSRVVIAVDSRVMPIYQMLVTITRPIEEAVNSVQGLQQVRSITSRGSAEIDLLFAWNIDMFQTLQRVDSALARVQATLPVAGMLPLAFGWGAESQMLQPLAIAVIGGILISMILSLVITPAEYFMLASGPPGSKPAVSETL